MTSESLWSPIKFEPEIERDYAQHMLKRLIPLGRLGSIIGAIAFAAYLPWDLLLHPEAVIKTGPIRLAVVFWFLIAFFITYARLFDKYPRYWPAFNFLIYTVVAAGLVVILARLPGGFVAGVPGFILGMIFIPVLVYSFRQAIALLCPLIVIPIFLMMLMGGTKFDVINAAAWIGGGLGFTMGFAYLLDIINRRAFQLERLLEEEKRRSEELLLNILPAEIAERLKAQEEPLADYCKSATVLFADLVGFTELSRKMSADQLVTLLNDLFSRFDELVEKHGGEKIKTIGDAYMVAAGMPGSVAKHVETIAELALDMRQAFAEFRSQHNLNLKLRIGVHSGAVVAGVIGKRKFAYDLWGDTVNIASRMESEGLPDEIQISAETMELLAKRFDVTPRGKIEIKGHLPRMTYLLHATR